jgi:CubicO group peptidase (beta-lactamase class C family)
MRRHYTASLAKSVVAGLSLTVALQDGLIGLNDFACDYIPPWQVDSARCGVRILHLATHCSGLDDAAEGDKPHGLLPGWKRVFWKREPVDPFTLARDEVPLAAEPGARFLYSNPGTAMLNYAVTTALQGTAHEDIRALLRERVYRPIGIDDEDWRIGYGTSYRVGGLDLVPGWAGGSFTTRAIARLGRLMLRGGDWQGRKILEADWIARSTQYADTPVPSRSADNPWPAATPGWWCNVDGILDPLPRDAFCGAGAANQVLLIVPSLDMIVVRNGGLVGDPKQGEGFWLGLKRYLFEPLMASV